jgi:serine/threonine protein phosphatase PrpC
MSKDEQASFIDDTENVSAIEHHVMNSQPPFGDPTPSAMTSTNLAEEEQYTRSQEGEVTLAPKQPAHTISGPATCGFMTEKIEDKGEDCHPFEFVWERDSGRRTLLAVFDGMGGAGSRKVPDVSDPSRIRSMAYLASRAARGAIAEACNQITTKMTPTEIMGVFEEHIQKSLVRLVNREGGIPVGGVRGSMVKDYPTTIAIALIDEEVDRRRVHLMWAGDSRIYALSPDSDFLLQQLTLDHTGSGASSDGGDAALTKCATPDSAELEYQDIDVPLDTIILAATDGCFAYESTQFLLTTLVEQLDRSNTEAEYSKNLAQALSDIAGDDCSMAISFGPALSFLQSQIAFRKYLRPLQDIRLVPKNNPFISFSSEEFFLKRVRDKQGE